MRAKCSISMMAGGSLTRLERVEGAFCFLRCAPCISHVRETWRAKYTDDTASDAPLLPMISNDSKIKATRKSNERAACTAAERSNSKRRLPLLDNVDWAGMLHELSPENEQSKRINTHCWFRGRSILARGLRKMHWAIYFTLYSLHWYYYYSFSFQDQSVRFGNIKLRNLSE
jgi:hypothetical protein